jgi:fructuronate reductase
MRDHPDIKADLANPERPSSAPGFIVRALAARRAAGLPPFTVMSCDNLPDNGHLLRGVVLDLAALVDPNLAAWIEKEGSFPATMVDRIVPATKDEDLDRVAELTGRRDESPVLHEPFRQWVIEDDFVDGMRPDLGAVGVELVEDVAPYEAMKLRCLNGTHSTLAYLGYLAGHETIAETVADEAFARFVTRVWDEEIIPGLTPPPGVSLTDYSRALLARYANPGIRHRTWQIAMDGSQKLPQRILTQLAEGLAAGRAMSGLTLAVAAWMRYVGGTDEKGAAIDVRDPMAEKLKALSDAAPDPRGKAMALLGVAEVFPAELRDNADFRERLATAYAGLAEKGARAMVESCHA